ncbi:MAG: hypothetical protein JW914_04285 [Syntrophaceae bacterium]|nr:hypothetical protein [Syntrophaceae bacterium]
MTVVDCDAVLKAAKPGACWGNPDVVPAKAGNQSIVISLDSGSRFACPE